MKKTLIKLLSSTIALTLVLASSSAGTAQIDKIKTEDVKADNTVAVVQEVKEENEGTGVIEVLEEKMKEEVPVVEVKAEPVAIPKAEVAAPETEVKAEEAAVPAEEVAAPEIEAVPVEEVAEPEAEPVETWNISASEFDNVAMTFYAEPAADASQVEIDRQSGVVRISGTGAMEENVYRHFLSVEKYLATIEVLLENEYKVDVDLVYDETITDVLELDRNIRFYEHETGKQLYTNENIRTNLNPVDFLEYSPKTIIIEEGITNVSDYAFVFCGELEEVILSSTVTSIGECAFQYCGKLTRVVIPDNVEIKDSAFLYCSVLNEGAVASEASNN